MCMFSLDPDDYTRTSGSLLFAPFDSLKRVVVVIRDDDVVEYPERLFLTLSVPDSERGVVLVEPRRVAITIANDDSKYMFAECKVNLDPNSESHTLGLVS